MNIAIITARGGEQALPGKNLIKVGGFPIVTYPINAALESSLIDRVYVSTECALIAEVAWRAGADVIERPAEMAQPDSTHGETIRHAVDEVCHAGDNAVVLLGNTVAVDSALIDTALGMLAADDCDSVMSVWRAQDDHPFRAMELRDGYAKSFMFEHSEYSPGSARQSYPPLYFYDQGVWAFEAECAERCLGPPPWDWLGERCRIIEREWVTGRDIHGEIDVSASEWMLNR